MQKEHSIKIIFLSIILLSLIIVSSCSVENRPDRLDRGDRPDLIGADDTDDTTLLEDPINTEITTEFPQINEDYVTKKSVAGTYEYDGNTPVYVTIFAHNEDSWGSVVGTQDKYEDYRSDLVEKLQTMVDYGAKFNWQTDYVVLEAMAEYESEVDQSNTNNKHILKYMTEDLGFSVDPHTHTYNMADVTKLISDQGITSSTVIGGVRAFECQANGELEGTFTTNDWHAELELVDGMMEGDLFDVSWEPTILSGAAMGGHWYDSFASGIWRPGIEENFYQHSSDEDDIILFGHGYPHDRSNLGDTQSSGAYVYSQSADHIKELVEMIQTGQVPSGKIYPLSLHIRDQPTIRKDGDQHDTLPGLRHILEELESYAEDNSIVYVTIQEAIEIWETQYNSEPNILPLSQFSIYEDVLAQAKDYCETQPGGRAK